MMHSPYRQTTAVRAIHSSKGILQVVLSYQCMHIMVFSLWSSTCSRNFILACHSCATALDPQGHRNSYYCTISSSYKDRVVPIEENFATNHYSRSDS